MTGLKCHQLVAADKTGRGRRQKEDNFRMLSEGYEGIGVRGRLNQR